MAAYGRGMRSLRILTAEFWYHVTSRGVLGHAIFIDDFDRREFLAVVEEVVRLHDVVIHAYCLMGNHFHLVVQTPGANLDAAMQRLNSGYAQYFNRRHERQGHLFERRYWSDVIEGDEHALNVVRYVVRNPVRAKLCPAADDWPWSSHLATIGAEPAPACLDRSGVLGLFDGRCEEERRQYEQFVAEGVDEPLRPELADIVAHGDLESLVAAHRRWRYTLRQIEAATGIPRATLGRRIRAEWDKGV